MRVLLFIILGSIILTGCNQQNASEDETATQEAASEENAAENSQADDNGEEAATEESDAEQSSPDEETDTQAESDGDESENSDTEDEGSETESAEEPPVNLLADVSFKNGYWINYRGEDDGRSHMTRTDFITYDPEKDYTVTAASYVSYYYGEEFIKTNSYGHEGSMIIETVPGADRVIISVEKDRKDELEFYNAALEDAVKGEVVNTTPDSLVGRGKLVEENLKGQIMFGQEFLSEENLMMGERIDEEGNFVEEEDYAVTEALKYNTSTDYAISVPAYISYYSGSDFIKTVEVEEAPAYIPKVAGANYINISFEEEFIYELNVIEME